VLAVAIASFASAIAWVAVAMATFAIAIAWVAIATATFTTSIASLVTSIAFFVMATATLAVSVVSLANAIKTLAIALATFAIPTAFVATAIAALATAIVSFTVASAHLAGGEAVDAACGARVEQSPAGRRPGNIGLDDPLLVYWLPQTLIVAPGTIGLHELPTGPLLPPSRPVPAGQSEGDWHNWKPPEQLFRHWLE
jgi:hypothetical protein